MSLTGRLKPKELTTFVLVTCLILVPTINKLISYPAYAGPDDAFIHMSVAKNVVTGHGWGVSPDTWVNVSTSPLFVIILIPVFAVASIGLAQILTLAFSALALLITYLVTARATHSRTAGLAALAVAATNVHLWRWSGTVMEATLGYLAVTIITAISLALTRKRRNQVAWSLMLGFAVGLGSLVRFEIGLLLPIATAYVLASRRKYPRKFSGEIAAILVGFSLPVLSWLIFASLNFSTTMPTSFAAKNGSGLNFVNFPVAQQLLVVILTGSGVSILMGVALAGVGLMSTNCPLAISRYRSYLIFLLAWPAALFLFYYLKTYSDQLSASRYFLPGMATWPIAFGLLVASNLRCGWQGFQRSLAAGLVLSLAFASVINFIRVAPVLSGWNGGNKQALTDAASYLRGHCVPGDVALIEWDIGVISYDGIGDCRLADGAALASPELRNMNLKSQIATVRPNFVLQTTGSQPNEWAATFPQLKLVFSESYGDRTVSNAGKVSYLNLYEVTERE